ncbi:choice-of-anchor V domain-containing protein [Rhodohalobacter barkolensis]|uniref:Uncharacterized protein n=1 Tax=Rhodohalobacter barkolensis TaxID=2053187 RepID=A0A2N0VE37_9BACT|nr:choice-of-anchor V domain-containing protein [Rhodohalobacter barkolensis]PKD42457.1 hypothetical protein CWD77_13645 [Rhodohalobacter barkolensis]
MKILLKLLGIVSIPFIVGLSMPEVKSNHSLISKVENPDHLDGAFTGGFGEETCRSCHFDYDLNMDGGSLTMDGVPETYEAGKDYEITIKLKAEQLEVGGFQMTTRFEDGSQAGEFSWEGNDLMFTPSVSDEVKYLQHSASGTQKAEDRTIQWSFTWKAPEQDGEKVILNIAANSGNYDDSSFGDWIYADETTLEQDN